MTAIQKIKTKLSAYPDVQYSERADAIEVHPSRNRQDEPQGVFSHATALTLHDLSDVMPATSCE